jgi:ATP-dependent Lon protease
MAAKRAKVMTIILPEANRADFEELSSMVKKDVPIKFAETYQDIFDHTFTNN